MSIGSQMSIAPTLDVVRSESNIFPAPPIRYNLSFMENKQAQQRGILRHSCILSHLEKGGFIGGVAEAKLQSIRNVNIGWSCGCLKIRYESFRIPPLLKRGSFMFNLQIAVTKVELQTRIKFQSPLDTI